MRLQESPPIQPRRNHRDRAWSMLPVLQALMYCLWQKRRRMLRGRGLRHRLGGPTRERPPAETTTGWWGRGGRGKGHWEPRFAHWGFLLGRIPAHPGTQWDVHLLRQTMALLMLLRAPWGPRSFLLRSGQGVWKKDSGGGSKATARARPLPYLQDGRR